MKKSKRTTSVGKLLYITFFVATLTAMSLTPVPYGFIYPIAFIVICGAYVIWKVNQEEPEPEESIIDEWEREELES